MALGNKTFGKFAIGLFIAALLIIAFGLMMSRNQRAAITDSQTPMGQIKGNPTAQESAPAAQPEQPATTESATTETAPANNQ